MVVFFFLSLLLPWYRAIFTYGSKNAQRVSYTHLHTSRQTNRTSSKLFFTVGSRNFHYKVCGYLFKHIYLNNYAYYTIDFLRSCIRGIGNWFGDLESFHGILLIVWYSPIQVHYYYLSFIPMSILTSVPGNDTSTHNISI